MSEADDEARVIAGRKSVKDMDDLPILEFLAMLERQEIISVYNTGSGLSVFRPTTGTFHEGFANSILNAVPYGGPYPDKLRRAKIKSMVQRGLIDGCLCGCRGDFELTDEGRRILEARGAVRPGVPVAVCGARDSVSLGERQS